MKTRGLIVMLLLCANALSAQHYTGLDVEDELDTYKDVAREDMGMSRRRFMILSPSYSLKKYAPTPLNQGQHGTCVAWSTTYAACTILEAIHHGWKNTQTVSDSAFAPVFTYAVMKGGNDRECKKGGSIHAGLKVLRKYGAVKMAHMPQKCVATIEPEKWERGNTKNFNYYAIWKNHFGAKAKIRAIKESIARKSPVVIGMKCMRSFVKASGVWKPVENDKSMGGHAMCIVGYDDDKYGGAFEIQNSWGTEWGNSGYMWVKYEHIAEYVHTAYKITIE